MPALELLYVIFIDVTNDVDIIVMYFEFRDSVIDIVSYGDVSESAAGIV